MQSTLLLGSSLSTFTFTTRTHSCHSRSIAKNAATLILFRLVLLGRSVCVRTREKKWMFPNVVNVGEFRNIGGFMPSMVLWQSTNFLRFRNGTLIVPVRAVFTSRNVLKSGSAGSDWWPDASGYGKQQNKGVSPSGQTLSFLYLTIFCKFF